MAFRETKHVRTKNVIRDPNKSKSRNLITCGIKEARQGIKARAQKVN
jgi:hypothetical protein